MPISEVRRDDSAVIVVLQVVLDRANGDAVQERQHVETGECLGMARVTYWQFALVLRRIDETSNDDCLGASELRITWSRCR